MNAKRREATRSESWALRASNVPLEHFQSDAKPKRKYDGTIVFKAATEGSNGLEDLFLKPEEVGSEVLKYLRHLCDLRSVALGAVVLAVPSRFTSAQRKATLKAAELADIKVLELIDEPSAVALAHFVEDPVTLALRENNNVGGGDRYVVVGDWGGGTWDVVVVKFGADAVNVLASDGDAALGGVDVDHAIALHMLRQWRDGDIIDHSVPNESLLTPRFLREIERAKLAVNDGVECEVKLKHKELGVTLEDGAQDLCFFQADCWTVLEESFAGRLRQPLLRAVCEAKRKDPNFDTQGAELLLAGGSGQLVNLAKVICDGEEPVQFLSISVVRKPQHAVARGATWRAVFATQGAKNLSIGRDAVLPNSVGVQTGIYFSRILRAGERLPCSATSYFESPLGAVTLPLAISEGCSPYFCENEALGTFLVPVKGSGGMGAGGRSSVEVIVSVDRNGLVTVSYRPREKGCDTTSRLVVRPSLSVRGQEERRQKLAAGAHHAADDEKLFQMLDLAEGVRRVAEQAERAARADDVVAPDLDRAIAVAGSINFEQRVGHRVLEKNVKRALPPLVRAARRSWGPRYATRLGAEKDVAQLCAYLTVGA